MSRRIVITGISRGLGLAMAAGFQKLGHTVMGCASNPSAIEKAGESLKSVKIARVDVTNDAEVASWAASVIRDGGPPDLLLNNAAVINPNAKLWKLSSLEFDRVMMVNVCGVANVLRHFVPSMVSNKSGVIVNFSSGWGRSVSAEVAPYCASKWAVEGLTLALAEELPNGMCAVPLNPGIINTDMLQSCFSAGANMYPSPEEWAKRSVPFLLSLTGRHNGQQLTVPGEE
jgi:NAD(P)-dependent dehydrogenase (short-subunit alcohol dehydrogenase family)